MTITRVMQGDEWGNDYGRNQSYTLDLQLEDGSVVQDIVSNRKIKDDGTHKEPQEQEVVWGDLLPMPKGQRKLKLDYEAMKQGGAPQQFSHGSSSETSTSNNSKPASSGEVDWDRKNGEIRRQHSQEMALRTMAIIGWPSKGTSDILRDVAFLADEFDADAIAAGQKASQGAVPATSSPQESPPLGAAPDSSSVDLSGARTTEPGVTDRDEVLKLLDYAGLVHAPAREKVADYITGPLLVEGRSDAALSALQDLDRQGNALAQLQTKTEEWIKGPLPTADGFDDSIPF